MFRLDAVLIRGNYFEHNAYKAAIILVICMFFIYYFLLLIICFLILQLFWWVGWNLGVIFILVINMYCFCKLPNYNIYFLIKLFDVVFLFIPSLCWHRGTGLWVIQCVSIDYKSWVHQIEIVPNYFIYFSLCLALTLKNYVKLCIFSAHFR